MLDGAAEAYLDPGVPLMFLTASLTLLHPHHRVRYE